MGYLCREVFCSAQHGGGFDESVFRALCLVFRVEVDPNLKPKIGNSKHWCECGEASII